MFDNYRREKLVNAINYFSRNTQHCHTLKIFKLLNFLDFEHYRQTGLSVTGLDYTAWPQGPVPPALWREFQNPGSDLKASVSITPVTDDLTSELLRRDIRAVAAFDETYFSKRELEIMKLLSEIFRDAKGNDMSDFSHSKNMPWQKVFGTGKGRGKEIPYDLSRSTDPILKQHETLSDEDHAYRRSAFS